MGVGGWKSFNLFPKKVVGLLGRTPISTGNPVGNTIDNSSASLVTVSLAVTTTYK
jgi:hypothetical protein